MKLFVAVVLALLSAAAQAQSWPNRTVKFILSLGPGSGADITGRMLADRLQKVWGQPVIVENRPGADAVLAINAVIAAKDDHTLLYGPSGSFIGHPYVLDKVPYDRNELLPVARVSNTVVVLAVPATFKAQNLKDLLQMAKDEPGKLNYASVSQVYDIMMAAYLKSAGIDMARVAYKDAVSAQNDLVEGRIQVYSAAYAIVRGHVQGGRIRLIAVQNRTRAPGLDVPTAAEAGFPQLTLDGLVGLVATRSSGITDAVRDRIAADVKAQLEDHALHERMTATGQIVNPGTPAEFAAAIDEQSRNLAAWSKTIGGKLR